MALHLWTTFALAYLATTLSPGPNVLLIVRNALRYGAPAMTVTLLGNLSAQLLVTSGVALGVDAILVAIPTAFLALKIAGAGYLIYLGFRQLFIPARALQSKEAIKVFPRPSNWNIGTEAFLVSTSNPKTLIFLCAFLPQFLDHDRPIFGQFMVMYITVAAIVVFVHSVYCYTAYRFSKRFNSSRWVSAALKRTTGALFIGLGVRLLNTKALGAHPL